MWESWIKTRTTSRMWGRESACDKNEPADVKMVAFLRSGIQMPVSYTNKYRGGLDLRIGLWRIKLQATVTLVRDSGTKKRHLK